MQLSLFTKKQPLIYEDMNHKYISPRTHIYIYTYIYTCIYIYIFIFESFEYFSMILHDNLGITIHMNM